MLQSSLINFNCCAIGNTGKKMEVIYINNKILTQIRDVRIIQKKINNTVQECVSQNWCISVHSADLNLKIPISKCIFESGSVEYYIFAKDVQAGFRYGNFTKISDYFLSDVYFQNI